MTAQDDGLPDKGPRKAPLQILQLRQPNHQPLNHHRALMKHMDMHPWDVMFNPQLRSTTSVQDQHIDSGTLNAGGGPPIARMAIPPPASPRRPLANFGTVQTPVRPLQSQHMTQPQQTPAQRAARRLEAQITDYGPMASPGPRRRDWNDNTSDEDETDLRSEQSVEENDSEPEEAPRPPTGRRRANVAVLNSDDSDDESQKPSDSRRQQPRGRRGGRQGSAVVTDPTQDAPQARKGKKKAGYVEDDTGFEWADETVIAQWFMEMSSLWGDICEW
ncbi:hypothetical protein B0H11DRAFT_2299694 [Mycena galericulata]|nr:hypothetical protein B0H11DRAFT_2299694 [Mycena galericulata]